MLPEQQRLTPSERDRLVAYLDGELSTAEAQEIATKLTHSPTARREVEILERTWELLDHLPRPSASEDLVSRTLTRIELKAERVGQIESAVAGSARRVLGVAAWVAGAIAAGILGFTLTNAFWPDPTRSLLNDLSIAEHLDEYLDVGDMEFLEALENSPEFGVEAPTRAQP